MAQTSRESSAPRHSVLVVDDDAEMGSLVADIARDQGYEATSITAPALALPLLSQRAFDLVVTDVRMPDIDGVALIEILRRADPRVAIIAMTGFGSMDTAMRVGRAGALDYVLKPFSPADLAARMASALERPAPERPPPRPPVEARAAVRVAEAPAVGAIPGSPAAPEQASAKAIGVSVAGLAAVLAFCSIVAGREQSEVGSLLAERTHARSEQEAEAARYERLATLTAIDSARLLELVKRTRAARDAAGDWAASFEPAIGARSEAAGRYAWGRVAAQVGVVAGSIALLRRSRLLWVAALSAGAAALVVMAVASWAARGPQATAAAGIESAAENYAGLRKARDERAGDEDLLLRTVAPSK